MMITYAPMTTNTSALFTLVNVLSLIDIKRLKATMIPNQTFIEFTAYSRAIEAMGISGGYNAGHPRNETERIVLVYY
jgi:hypothetical protein